MVSCHTLKKGQKLVCAECGLELEVIKQCKDCTEESGCKLETCEFKCCDQEMKLK